MIEERPCFEVFENDGPEMGWRIRALWTDGRSEYLAGLFSSEDGARKWLIQGANRWLEYREAQAQGH
jgi:hypothetical protein